MLAVWMAWTAGTGAAAEHDVLLVGNSYTQRNGLARALQTSLRTAPGWSDATVRAITAPGATLADHAAAAEAGSPSWTSATSTHFGAVVFQDQSQVPGLGPEHPTTQASQAGLLALVDRLEPTRTVLLQTWGRRDGDTTNPVRYPDFPTMQDRLTEGYAAYAMTAGAEVAPAGEGFRAVYDADPVELFPGLYEADGSHPSPAGTDLAMAMLHATLTGTLPSAGDRSPVVQDAVRRLVPIDPPADPSTAGCHHGPGTSVLSWAALLALLGYRRCARRTARRATVSGTSTGRSLTRRAVGMELDSTV